MAPLFQAREIPRIVPSLPPVKRLAADTEVATGQRRILSMPPVMVQPLQSCFCQPADPLDPAYDFGTRSSRTYYLHDDTILGVTYHYEREQGVPALVVYQSGAPNNETIVRPSARRYAHEVATACPVPDRLLVEYGMVRAQGPKPADTQTPDWVWGYVWQVTLTPKSAALHDREETIAWDPQAKDRVR